MITDGFWAFPSNQEIPFCIHGDFDKIEFFQNSILTFTIPNNGNIIIGNDIVHINDLTEEELFYLKLSDKI